MPHPSFWTSASNLWIEIKCTAQPLLTINVIRMIVRRKIYERSDIGIKLQETEVKSKCNATRSLKHETAPQWCLFSKTGIAFIYARVYHPLGRWTTRLRSLPFNSEEGSDRLVTLSLELALTTAEEAGGGGS